MLYAVRIGMAVNLPFCQPTLLYKLGQAVAA
jgi:hypothetical protein